MTVYLTSALTPEEVEWIATGPGVVHGVKWYPPHPGATTGSGHGLPLRKAYETLRAMEEVGLPLLLHGETVLDQDGNVIPHLLRENYFIEHELSWLLDYFPDLRIVFEHASTAQAAELIRNDQSGKLAATVTPQHLWFVHSDLKRLSWGNHLKCMPIVKTPDDRDALRELVVSGHPCVFLGTDSAAHLSNKKTGVIDCCANGCFTPHALLMYAQMFEEMGALDGRFHAFASLNGPRWYGLPEPTDTIVLIQEHGAAPKPVPVPEESDIVIPLGYTDAEDGLKTTWEVNS